ncbi:MAG: marine proteobacterial sortase target protein [Halioglobus sp.]
MRYSDTVYTRLARDADRFGGFAPWLAFRCLPLLLAAALLLLFCIPKAGATAPATPPEMEGDSGLLWLREEGSGGYRPAVMQMSRVHFAISGMVATVTLEQSFRNDSDRWQEGVYGFPLPETAAVRHLEMVVGERRIVGRVRERAVAEKIYREAKASGRKASLVEQQRPNLFTNRVANIGPGEVITVRLEYVQEVAFIEGEFSLRFPMTLTPRYMPGSPVTAPVGEAATLSVNPYLGWARATDRVPDADAISPLQHPGPGSDGAPLNPVAITATLDAGMPLARVASPYHDIAMERRGGVYEIGLAGGASEMDRDFVLTWQPVTGAAPAAALFTEEVGGEYFGLLMVVPPRAEPAAVAPREIVFVVDTSGSMGGVAIEQARASMTRALRQLSAGDRFNIIAFDSTHRALFRAPVPASRHHVGQALEFVRQMRASGGTEMLPALRAALTTAAVEEESAVQLRQVIFITDGAVGNEVELFGAVNALLGDHRLFTVGIGSAPNSWFMRKAAQFGRGTHTHIGDLDDIDEKMSGLFEQLARPAATDLAVAWPTPVDAWPKRIPDLYRGHPLLVAVHFGDAPPAGDIQIPGHLAGRPWQTRLQSGTPTDSEVGTPTHSQPGTPTYSEAGTPTQVGIQSGTPARGHPPILKSGHPPIAKPGHPPRSGFHPGHPPATAWRPVTAASPPSGPATRSPACWMRSWRAAARRPCGPRCCRWP